MKSRLVWAVLLILIASALITATASADEQCELGSITASDSLNLRAKASTDSEILAKIPGGSRVLILGRTGSFFKIRYDGHVGYVSDAYTIRLKSWVGYATENLNLRASSSTSAKRLGTIDKGDSLYVYGTSGDFYLVVAGDVPCYVAREYIAKKKPGSSAGTGSSSSKDDSDAFDPKSTAYYVKNPPEFSEDDLYLAAQLIYSEGNSQSETSYLAMASVVYNRVRSSRFPNTVFEVTFQKNQFSMPDNNPERFLELVPSKRAQKAVERVFVAGERILPPDVMYFKSGSLSKDWGKRQYYCSVGGNMYYK